MLNYGTINNKNSSDYSSIELPVDFNNSVIALHIFLSNFIFYLCSNKNQALMKVLAHSLIYVRNIYGQCASPYLRRNLEHSCDQVTFRMSLSKKITVLEVTLIQVSFPNVDSKQKNKNKHMEYHGIFMPLKSQIYSKHRSPTSLLLRSRSLVSYLHVPVKTKNFLVTLTWQTQLTFNVSMKTVNELSVSNGVCPLSRKDFLLFHAALLKCFIFSRLNILHSQSCHNSCRTD